MKEEYDFSEAKRGAVLEPKGKTRISIYVDDDIVAAFRARAEAEGKSYDALINAALRRIAGCNVEGKMAREDLSG